MEKIVGTPLDSKEIKPVILKEIKLEYLLEELMLKLKLQYFGHLTETANSLEITLILGKTDCRETGSCSDVRGHVHFSSLTQSCPTLCDPMDCSMPGFPVPHQLPELTQTYVHRVGDVIQPSHLLSSPSPPTFNLFQNQGLFK